MFREFHHQVKGVGHFEKGGACQDKTSYASGNGVQVLCLADGAGSAENAEMGARILVDEGCRMLLERFEEFAERDDGANIKIEIVEGLLERLGSFARQRNVNIKDLAATFLAVAVSGDKFIVAHIGDGIIGYQKEGHLKVASAPENDEFANCTTFVTSTNAARSMRLLRGQISGVTGFVLMSDGAAASMYDHKTKLFAPACSKIIALVGSSPWGLGGMRVKYHLRRFLATKVRAATKDDCSLAVFARVL